MKTSSFSLRVMRRLSSEAADHLVLKGMWKCDETKDYEFNVVPNLKNNVIVEANFTLKRPFGNVPGVIQVEYSRDEKYFVSLATLHERDICTTFNNYGSQVWLEMQRRAQVLQPGQCPIRKGSYTIKNYKLELDKMKVQGLPKGVVRVNSTYYDHAKNVLGCYVLVLESK